ncbi:MULTISPECIES: hypothetical protein [Cyanophyceae]|uniref:hypothetical protein n=1 Tax=Cyanophyceae TaxID=3028117 RepID=UPI00168729A0|nr:hypothetical protein [Trichocoleus sp. FACHB-40]MBD2001907.1 hypothetical protein [Trichocoleus sp. FACHB-40]
MNIELSKRDKLLLAIAALVEVDDRQGGRRNEINFSGSLLTSENMNYLAEQCEGMWDWTEQQLINSASAWLEKLGGDDE